MTEGGAWATAPAAALISASATRALMSAIDLSLDGLDETFEHVVEQLDLLVIEAAGGRQEKIGDTRLTVSMHFAVEPPTNGSLDFINNRLPGDSGIARPELQRACSERHPV